MYRLTCIAICGLLAAACSEKKGNGKEPAAAGPAPTAPTVEAPNAEAPKAEAPPAAPARPLDLTARLKQGQKVIGTPIVWPAGPSGWTIAVVNDNDLLVQLMAYSADRALELGGLRSGTYAMTPVGDTLVVRGDRGPGNTYGTDTLLQVRWDARRTQPVPGRLWECAGKPEPPCAPPAWATTAPPAEDLKAIGPVPTADEARAAVDAWLGALGKGDLATAAALWAMPWRMRLDDEAFEPATAAELEKALKTFIDETGGTLGDLHKALPAASFEPQPTLPELAGVGPAAPVLYVMLSADTDDASVYDVGLVVGRFDGKVKIAGATVDAAHGKGH
jgi:hypothetical protein